MLRYSFELQLKICSLTAWSKSRLQSIDNRIVKVASVYWSNSLIAIGGGVYAKWIENLDMSNEKEKYTAILENASWAYIVTWDSMTPNTNPKTLDQVRSIK